MGNILRRIRNSNPTPQDVQQIEQESVDKNEEKMIEQSIMKQEKYHFAHVYVKFKGKASKKQIEKVSKIPQVIDMMKNETWFIDFNNEAANFSEFLDIIQECEGVNTIKINTPPKQPLYCSNILNIRFSHLNKLILSNCWLQSIQFFAQIYMPNLRELNLSNNFIINIKTLRRIKVPIEVINIRQNKLPSIIDSDIHHINFNQCMECFNIQEYNNKYYGDDSSWLFKLPSLTIRRIEINSRFRIPTSPNKFQMLMDRFKGKDGIFCWGPRSAGYMY